MKKNDELINALLAELKHYETFKNKKRADEVKAELKKAGWKAPKEKTETKKKQVLMAITNGYCALSELKAYIGITDSNDDNQLEDA